MKLESAGRVQLGTCDSVIATQHPLITKLSVGNSMEQSGWVGGVPESDRMSGGLEN